jgi:hypothetical protein
MYDISSDIVPALAANDGKPRRVCFTRLIRRLPSPAQAPVMASAGR